MKASALADRSVEAEQRSRGVEGGREGKRVSAGRGERDDTFLFRGPASGSKLCVGVCVLVCVCVLRDA